MDVKPQHKRQWQLYLDFIETSRNLTHEPDTNLAKHHIIPRHLGGTDDEDNLVKLTYADHAKAHRLLYETFGLAGDHRAWRMWETHAQDEQKFLDAAANGGAIGGKIGGKATVESHGPQMANGGKASVASHGPQLANGGKATVESHGPQLANGGKANVASGQLASIQSKGGEVQGRKNVESGHLAAIRSKGAATSAVKWISLYDGHICPRSWISRRNKEDPNRIGTWVEL